MFGNRKQHSSGWPIHPGDPVTDGYSVSGLVACLLGIGTLAATLTAAGYGFAGWTAVGAVLTALLWTVGIIMLVVEHQWEEPAENRFGPDNRFHHGHAG